MLNKHLKYMNVAISEAIKAQKKNEIPIGAVLIDKNGHIIAKNHNQTIIDCDPTAHAEIKLLRAAANKLQNYRLLDTTLYVTIEPCIMCMGAIIHARIGEVVFGASDIKWGAAGSLYNFASNPHLNHKIKIIQGICANRCRLLMQNFFRSKRKRF